MKPYLLCACDVHDPKTGTVLFTRHNVYALAIVLPVAAPLGVRVVPGQLIFALDLREAIKIAGTLLAA